MLTNALLPLLFTLGSGTDLPLTEVTLRENARTPGTRIQLGDIVHPDDLPYLTDELRDTDLGRSPTVGFNRLLDRRAILAAVPPGFLHFTGAEEVSIQTDVTQIDADQLIEAAREALFETTSLTPDTEVEVSNIPRELRVPRGRHGIELKARLRGAPRNRGAIPVKVDVLVDGALASSTQVTFLLRTFAWVPVLKSDLRKGETLNQSDLDDRRIETTRMNTLPIDDATSMIGYVAKRNLRAGDYISDRDYDLPIYVDRNQPVTIGCRKGNLVVEAFGLARDQGRLGDIIRVENLRTRKILYGRVIAPGRVEMN